jgi:hypothetical protein
MIGIETQEVERKEHLILKILNDSREPLGARVISRHLKDCGINLGERAVRYHLKLMDERGLTRLVSRDGRLITKPGIEELGNALVRDKVGFAMARIELLAFRTHFDWEKGTGLVPVNVSFFPKNRFEKALLAMKPVFAAGICVSDLVAVAREGEQLGELIVPAAKQVWPRYAASLSTTPCSRPACPWTPGSAAYCRFVTANRFASRNLFTMLARRWTRRRFLSGPG